MGTGGSRPVRLGMVDILWPFATHWAVQVDNKWYEVAGASKDDADSPMKIITSHGQRSAVGDGADALRFGHVGSTCKNDWEIFWFIHEWKGRNQRYSFSSDNCQKFAREFIDFLTEGQHKPLPMMDAGVGGGRIHGPHAWSGAEDGAAYAGAMVAHMQGHHGLLNGALVALRASACALCGKHGFGVFGEAELGRAEGGIGPVRVAIHLNANTAIGVRSEGVEISLLGFGFTAGANGLSASLPVCTVGVGRALGPNV
jgi:hypothetical protein